MTVCVVSMTICVICVFCVLVELSVSAVFSGCNFRCPLQVYVNQLPVVVMYVQCKQLFIMS